MTARFLSNTKYANTEFEMQLIPGFTPRGPGGQGAGHSGHRRLPGGGGAGRLGKKGKVI